MSTKVAKDTAQKKYDYLSESLLNAQEYAQRLHEQVKQSLHAIDRLTENNQALRRKNKALVKHIADQDKALRRKNKRIIQLLPPKDKDCPACQAKTPPPADGARRCWKIPLDYPKLAELEKELKAQIDAALPPALPPAPPPKKQDMPWRGDRHSNALLGAHRRQLDNLEAALHPPADEMSAGIRQHDSLVGALCQTTKAPKRRHIHVTVNGKVMEWVQAISPEGMSPSCAICYVREPEAAPAEPVTWGKCIGKGKYLLPKRPVPGEWLWLDKEHPVHVISISPKPGAGDLPLAREGASRMLTALGNQVGVWVVRPVFDRGYVVSLHGDRE